MLSDTKKIILSFTACHFLLIFSYTIILAFLPLYFESKAISEKGIGMLVAVNHLMSLPTVVLFGVISDRFSPKRLCKYGALLYALYLFGVSRTGSFSLFFLLQIMGGASFAICIVTLNSLFFKHLSLSNRGKKIGLFLAGSYLGFGIGPYLAGLVAGWFDLQGVFWVASGAATLLFLLTSTLKDYPIQSFRMMDYVRDMRSRRAMLVILCFFIEGIHVGAEHLSYTLLMKHQLGLSVAEIGLFYLLLAVFFAFVTYSIGHWVDRETRWIGFFLAIGMLISGIFQLLTGTVTTFGGLVLIRYLHILGDGFLMWTLAYFVSMIFPDKRLGGNYGFTRVINTIGMSLGAFVFGLVMGKGGYPIPFYLSGGIEILIAGFFFTQVRYLNVSHHKHIPLDEAQQPGAPDRPIP